MNPNAEIFASNKPGNGRASCLVRIFPLAIPPRPTRAPERDAAGSASAPHGEARRLPAFLVNAEPSEPSPFLTPTWWTLRAAKRFGSRRDENHGLRMDVFNAFNANTTLQRVLIRAPVPETGVPFVEGCSCRLSRRSCSPRLRRSRRRYLLDSSSRPHEARQRLVPRPLASDLFLSSAPRGRRLVSQRPQLEPDCGPFDLFLTIHLNIDTSRISDALPPRSWSTESPYKDPLDVTRSRHRSPLCGACGVLFGAGRASAIEDRHQDHAQSRSPERPGHDERGDRRRWTGRPDDSVPARTPGREGAGRSRSLKRAAASWWQGAVTSRFDSAPVMYEAGVAEAVYDYEAIGPDPLRQLIGELGLRTVATHSSAVVMNGAILRD